MRAPNRSPILDTVLARKMWATLEPYHAFIYFAPEAFEAWEALGFPRRGMGYFASRAAPMGPVSAPTVAAAFYNFNPDLVARYIPAAWDIAEPPAVTATRLGAVDRGLRRLLGEAIATDEMTRAAAAAGEAAVSCPPQGRPLFAGYTSLPWPEEPHLALWHALTLLREFRGDGHVSALLRADLDPVAALVSYSATERAPSASFYRRSRGWSEEDFTAAAERLRSRGWLDGEGALSEEGLRGREEIEEETDRLAMAPWQAIGQSAADELRALVRPWSRAIVGAGGLGDI